MLNFTNIVTQVLNEENTAGGAVSALGDVTVPWGDKTANDARIPNVLGGVYTRAGMRKKKKRKSK